MRLLSVFLAAAAAISFSASVEASVFIIDDFTVIQGPVTDAAGGGATVSGPVALDAGTRTISVEAFSRSPTRRAEAGVDFLVGDDGAALSLFGISNGSLIRSIVKLSYFINPIAGFDGAGETALVLNFLQNDPGIGNTTSLEISIPNANLGLFTIPQIPPASNIVSIALNSVQKAALLAGGPLIFTFDGSDAYDVALDSIALVEGNGELQPPQVPEPATLFTMASGMILTGFGLRRRKR